MTATIVEEIVRPPESIVDAFREESAADVHEAMDKTGAMAPEMTPATDGASVCGPAVTVALPEGDNMMIHVAAKLADPGNVIVIAANTTRAATWGELATRNALRKGIEGVVSDGNVRDIDRIEELGFPMFSRAVGHNGAVKNTPGSVNVPVSVGDVVVRPGDIVMGDSDGVTVVPQDRAEAVLENVAETTAAEAAVRERVEDGEELFDVIIGDEALDEHDVETVEGPVDYAESPPR